MHALGAKLMAILILLGALEEAIQDKFMNGERHSLSN